MTVRLTLTLAALGVALAGCATMPKGVARTPAPALAAAPPSNGPIGHSLDEIMAVNGPPTQQWDMPDGRRAYQWQSSSISATVAPARRGEIKAVGVSQTTCFYTLYTRPDGSGVVKVVGAEDTKPGCMTLAMMGQSK